MNFKALNRHRKRLSFERHREGWVYSKKCFVG